MTRHHLLLLLSLLLHLFIPSAIPSEARCLESHRDALLRLKSGFRNSSFYNSTTLLPSWTNATDSDCCVGWDGVTCNPVSGEVTALDLSGLFLSGKVAPGALFNLTTLGNLNLAFNNLDFGDVVSSPGGFEKLVGLTNLNLSYSGFKGQIPMGISTLTKVVSLDFSNRFSNISLKSPNLRELIRNMTRLEVLYLDGVDLSSDGGDWCDALSESHPRLQKVSLVSCNLSGPVDASIAKLGSLTVLRLDENNLTSKVPGFLGNLSSLEILGLSHCHLTGSIPEEIFHLRNLSSLDMSINPLLRGPLPDSTWDLPSLERLKLSNCMLSGSIPRSVERLLKLAELDLSNSNLSGELPSELETGSISAIVLANNNLTGSIPSKYGNLSSLTVLNLQNNSLTGQIPSSLFSLPSLKTLDLHQNLLSAGLEEFSNDMTALETVDLSRNNLQGPIPSSVFTLSNLKILLLANNNFSGEVELNQLEGLRNLSSLDLSYNRLTVKVPEGQNSSFPGVRKLRLASCNLDKFPLFLKDQANLSHLDLSFNKISGDIPSWLWTIGGTNSSFIHLNLSHNLFSGFKKPLPDPLNNPLIVIDLHSNNLSGSFLLPPAQNSVVDYSNNKLSSEIPRNISLYLNFTIFFSISNNSFSGSMPSSICKALFLRVLDVSHNNLSGPIPPCLDQLRRLHVLILRRNSFSGGIPSNFSEGCSLRTLNLNGNQLHGKIPISLKNCAMLEVLDLGNNRLDGQFPDWLSSLKDLRVLILRSNRLDGPVEAHGGSFNKLQIIDLSSNKFNGSLSAKHLTNWKAMMLADERASQPVVQFNYLQGHYYQDTVMITSKGQEMTLVKILTIYTSIDVSNNGFAGNIPDAIGKLNALAVLNTSYNHFSGVIPRSIGKLLQLESLDVSNNQLSGHIPEELASLSFLSFLNLSYNKLYGEIPRRGQFDTFSNASFVGNPGLCGLPLENCSTLTGPNHDSIASHNAIEASWLFIFVGFGLGGGLALAFGPLLLCKKWREEFNDRVDRLLLAIFPSCFWEWVSSGDGRVDVEEKMEEESDRVDEGHEHPFCIFCTGLEFRSGQAIICHRACSCTRDYK